MGNIRLAGASKECECCGQVFYPRYGESVNSWRSRKYCSTKCYREDEKKKTPSMRDRILDSVEMIPGCGCWIWMKSATNGYGVMGVGRKTYKAAHVAYREFVGDIPDGMLLHHTCWISLCINPAHMQPMPRGEQLSIAWDAGRCNPVVFENLIQSKPGEVPPALAKFNAERTKRIAHVRQAVEAHPVLGNIKFRGITGGYKMVDGMKIPIDPMKDKA